MKRWNLGTYQGLSRKYVDTYLNEFVFRYNRRFHRHVSFETLLRLAARHAPASYWDIGVRGDTGPSNHSSLYTLAPTYSVLTDATDYPGLHNTGANPDVAQQYCNGSRIPPELGASGWQVPPGIADATVPNPPFTLLPAATVDEGNNWVNMSWGPLALVNPVTNAPLGSYVPTASSSTPSSAPAA